MKKYKLNKLDSDETRTTLKNVISAKLQQENEVEQGVEDMWGDFKRKMIEAADEVVLGKKVAYRGIKKMTPWWTDDVRDAVKRKMVRFRKWMKSQRDNDRAEYIIARNEAERLKRRTKEDSWKKIGEDLKADLHGTRNLLYSLAYGYRGETNEGSYSVKDKNNNLLVDEVEIAERWKEYFSDLLNVEDNEANLNNASDENDVQMEENEDPITEQEVRTAIQKMKKGKSPGEINCLWKS